MIPTSPDVFAHANPAFGALVLHYFVQGYATVDAQGAEYALLFLPLPVVLSADYRKTFDRTNKRTGFASWIQNNVKELLGLPEVIATTSEYTRIAIRFGCSFHLLEFTRNGRVLGSKKGLRRKPEYPAREEIGACLTRAERLGIWCGQVGSASVVYNQLRISI